MKLYYSPLCWIIQNILCCGQYLHHCSVVQSHFLQRANKTQSSVSPQTWLYSSMTFTEATKNSAVHACVLNVMISWIFIIPAMVAWVWGSLFPVMNCTLDKLPVIACYVLLVGGIAGSYGLSWELQQAFLYWSIDPSYWLTLLWWNHFNYICIW